MFNDAYSSFKKSPPKDISKLISDATIKNGKREPEFEIDKTKKKKVRMDKFSDESDFDIEEFDALEKTMKSEEENTSKVGLRPRRATANRKTVVISDDEEDKKSGSFVVELEEVDECYF